MIAGVVQRMVAFEDKDARYNSRNLLIGANLLLSEVT
jgi:hypothetical protein